MTRRVGFHRGPNGAVGRGMSSKARGAYVNRVAVKNEMVKINRKKLRDELRIAFGEKIGGLEVRRDAKSGRVEVQIETEHGRELVFSLSPDKSVCFESPASVDAYLGRGFASKIQKVINRHMA